MYSAVKIDNRYVEFGSERIAGALKSAAFSAPDTWEVAEFGIRQDVPVDAVRDIAAAHDSPRIETIAPAREAAYFKRIRAEVRSTLPIQRGGSRDTQYCKSHRRPQAHN